MHAAAQGMARFRGLGPAAFEQAQAAVVAADHTFTWTSGWKYSPGRRWRARCSFRTMADGFGRLTVQVSTPDGSVAATSSEQVAWTTREGFARAARTLRWTAPDRIEVVPCIDWLGHDTGVFAVGIEARSPTAVRLRELELPALPRAPEDPDPRRAVEPPGRGDADDRRTAADRPVPPVLLVVPDPGTREIVAVGGGPTNHVPDRYWRALHALFDQLSGPDWQAWWAPADRPTLEVSWWAEEDGPERLFVRRGRDKVVARIERTSVGLRGADPVQAARDDLARLMAAVQQRMGLGAPPALR